MKKILLTLLIATFILLVPATISAMYQSIPQEGNAYGDVNDLFINVRKMEAAGQVMGLSEELNSSETPLRKTGTQSNNIDVHMTKNTEYGAAAMLAASKYGKVKSGVVNDLGTASSATTSNATGIYQMGDSSRWEYPAAIYNTTNEYISRLRTAADNAATAKYVDLYSNPTNQYTDYTGAKTGDATGETPLWYGAGRANFVYSSHPVFLRGSYGVFYFSYNNGRYYSSYGVRASAVAGGGL